MKIQKVNNYSYKQNTNKAVFKNTKTLKEVNVFNLGVAQDGYIGKISVLDKNSSKGFLNLFKEVSKNEKETYFLQDKFGNFIAKMDILTNNKDILEPKTGSKHLFIEDLKNFSKPETPYNIGWLEEYKQAGTRLMQIALKRSLETGSEGRIELNSDEESKEFYEKLGFKIYEKESELINPYRMFLPKENREILTDKYNSLEIL